MLKHILKAVACVLPPLSMWDLKYGGQVELFIKEFMFPPISNTVIRFL